MKLMPMLLVALLASSQFAGAAPQVQAPLAVTAEARGTPSCGEWVAHRKKSDTLSLSNTSWLVGYLSGLAVGSGKDFLPGTDNTAIFSFMDKYCGSNPLKDIGNGGLALMAEIMVKKGVHR